MRARQSKYLLKNSIVLMSGRDKRLRKILGGGVVFLVGPTTHCGPLILCGAAVWGNPHAVPGHRPEKAARIPHPFNYGSTDKSHRMSIKMTGSDL